MRPACSYTDFFVLCTGQSPRQTAAIYDEVHRQLKHDLDVVLHIFTPDARAYYRLEDLWGDVPSVELEAATA